MSDLQAGSFAETPPTEPKTSGLYSLVAVVGAPNCGKSTLFNRLTGLRQKVANYPGVTVEKRLGKVRVESGQEITLVDLPGIYSLTARSEDERVARGVLLGEMPGLAPPDAVLLVVDSTNLNRNLSLAAPILALGIPTLIVLNMSDDLRSRGGLVDGERLSEQLGVPVVQASAARGEGLEAIRAFLSGRSAARQRLELPVLQDIGSRRRWAVHASGQSGYQAPAASVWTRRLDSAFLHPLAGPLIFLLVVMAVFQSIFTLAQPLMDGTEAIISTSGLWIGSLLPDSWFRDLLLEGVWAGVGSVLVFLPQILFLFVLIGVMEDSGYLARAAVIADRTMARVGLEGKAFIPLLSAYACAIPAIMATRTIESRRERLATILIAPFMTCSARLPVYALVIAAFLPEKPLLGPFLGTRAAAMIGLYGLGFLAAVATARLLKSTLLKRQSPLPFTLELPPYRWPTLQSIGLRLADRSLIFLKRAGTVILLTTVVLWFLASVPRTDGEAPEISQSLAGKMGKSVEPVIEPLGFNWKIGIGLITSLAAREVIVGTLGTIYGIEAGEEGPDEGSPGLQQALKQDLPPGAAVALLIFFAFALQCMSTVAVVRRETGGWRLPLLQFAYMLALAYAGAWVGKTLVDIWI
ncbi:MAG: ferrous iron transporter B [Acidobacteria bacterium]|nr:ferrous iron transporter B [Acidobacteriota bacterium]